MQFQGAVIKEQGVTFAIVIVKPSVIQNKAEASQAISGFRPVFSDVPIVLMAQDSRGIPEYYGRRDIVRFMASVPLDAVRWKQYSLN